MASPTISSMTSFSGADLVVSFANQVIGELQGISWAIQREKAPVYTLGSADARSFSRGKRAIAGKLQFAVMDNDALVSAMQHVWGDIAPKGMFTAAGNYAKRSSEDFSTVLNSIKWNLKTSDVAQKNYVDSLSGKALKSDASTGYGFSGTSKITPVAQEGSNGSPATFDAEYNYFVESWNKGDNIYVPAGFSAIRGENIVYADTLPPFDVTLTFANEYGQTAFQKLYDLDILNESSGVTVDSIVMEREMTYIARRISPLIRGVYSRESGGNMVGIQPKSAS